MTTIKPVTIPREVAEEIEHLRSGYGYGIARDNAYICELWMRTGGGVPLATDVLRQIPFDTLMAALVNGYERELTEEEARVRRASDTLRKVYAENRNPPHYNADTYDMHLGIANGIEIALNAFDIKIEGVNA